MNFEKLSSPDSGQKNKKNNTNILSISLESLKKKFIPEKKPLFTNDPAKAKNEYYDN